MNLDTLGDFSKLINLFMGYKKYRRLPKSNLRMQLEFWTNIRSFINDGDKMTYKEVGDLFLKKFGYRVTKQHMYSKRSIDFDENGFAKLK